MSTLTPTHHDEGATPQNGGPEVALQIWRRRKWTGLLVAGITLAAAVGVVRSLPNLYQSTATVVVDRQELSDAFVKPSVTTDLETRIQMINERVMSRERLTDLITQYDLYPDLRGRLPMDNIVDQMRKDIQLQLKTVEETPGHVETTAFTIAYSGRDPRVVADVTNTLANTFIDENARTRRRVSSQTADLLQQQLSGARTDLENQTRKMIAFTSQGTGDLPQQLEANLAAINRLTTELQMNEAAQQGALETQQRIQAGLVDAAATVNPDDPAARILPLKRQLEALQARYKDDYPDITTLQTNIAALEAEIKKAGVKSVSPVADIDNKLADMKQRADALEKQTADYEARIARTPQRQLEFEDLNRDYNAAQDRYQTLLKQYSDARLAATLEQSQNLEQFHLLNAALPAAMPGAPNRVWLAVIGLLGAIGFGALAILIAEKTDTSFHTADDLRASVDVPVLATIRRIVTPKTARRRMWKRLLVAGATVVVFTLIAYGTAHLAAGSEWLVRLTARGGL